jgi:hypothetical protein
VASHLKESTGTAFEKELLWNRRSEKTAKRGALKLIFHYLLIKVKVTPKQAYVALRGPGV